MRILTTTIAITLLCTSAVVPALAQKAPSAARETQAADPSGTFVDEYGTSFTFSLCGDGTALCGVLNELKGKSATEENLEYVGKQVMQAQQSAPNEWKGALEAGGISASATVTQVSADTIEITGCRAILCQTLAYNRV